MNKRMTRLGAVMAALCAGVATAQTQPAPDEQKPAPAAAPAATEGKPVELTRTRIEVVSVEGRASFQAKAGDPRKFAKVGDVLSQGVTISLGLASKLVLRVGDGQELTFENLGNFVITEAVNDGNVDITRIEMTRGRVAFDVKKVRFANDVIIRTPDMTLAIKGTTGAIEHAAGRPTMAMGDMRNTGLIVLDHRASGRVVSMTGNERSNSAVPDPAMNLALHAVVETATDSARERDEVKIIKRGAEGNNQTIQLDLGDRKGTPSIDLAPVVGSKLKGPGR